MRPAPNALALRAPQLVRSGSSNTLEDLLRALFAPSAPLSLYVTLRDASTISGLTVPLLRRLVKAKLLPSIQDRCTKVLRADLDNLPRILARLTRTPKEAGHSPTCP